MFYCTNNEISWEEKKHTLNKILKADEVIKSPGIPDSIDIIKQLNKKRIPVISEIEFAFRDILPKYKSNPPKKIQRQHRRNGFETQNADKIFESTYQSQINNKILNLQGSLHLL